MQDHSQRLFLRDKYKTILSILSEGIVIINRDGTVETNRSADRILGFPAQSHSGCISTNPTISFYAENGKLLAHDLHPCQITLSTGKALSNVILGLSGDGNKATKWISVNTQPLWNSDSKEPDAVVISIREITQDIEARRAREEYISTLTHDLRTPLTAATFGAQKLLCSQEPVVRRAAERILSNIKRLDRMIRDLLDANRLRAGQALPLRRTPCDLAKLIVDSVDNLSAVHGERIIVEIYCEITVDACLDGLNRVLENLVNNAFKYGSTERQVTVSLLQEGGEALVSVHNFGEPIEDPSLLFEPYYRGRKADASTKDGWGLGLTIVKGIVDAHQGRVTVSSSRDEGTRFNVHLPLRKDQR